MIFFHGLIKVLLHINNILQKMEYTNVELESYFLTFLEPAVFFEVKLDEFKI
jgi:hypothetical protein